MDSWNLTERIRTRLANFRSSNGDEYKLSNDNNDVVDDHANESQLMDSTYQFDVYIEGKLSDVHRAMINQAIVFTWNLTAYQTKNFVNYFIKGYQFWFVPKSQLMVDADGKLQTKLVYFIASAGGKLASHDDFELVPKTSWLQDSFVKYDLPYVVLDHDDLITASHRRRPTSPHSAVRSARDYDKLYSVDFDSYIDPLDEDEIGSIILASFRRFYTGTTVSLIRLMLKFRILVLRFLFVCFIFE